MNEPKLERRPFCDNSAIVVEIGGGAAYQVKCHSIMECGAMTEKFDTEEEAVAAWNRRAPLPDNKALTAEELREMDGEPVWCEKKGAYVFVSTIIDEPYIQVYYFTNKGFLETVLYYHTKFYRRPPEKGE